MVQIIFINVVFGVKVVSHMDNIMIKVICIIHMKQWCVVLLLVGWLFVGCWLLFVVVGCGCCCCCCCCLVYVVVCCCWIVVVDCCCVMVQEGCSGGGGRRKLKKT